MGMAAAPHGGIRDTCAGAYMYVDKQGAFDVQVLRGKFVFLVMIPIGLTAFRGFEIFSQTFIREYFRLSDRIKHFNYI